MTKKEKGLVIPVKLDLITCSAGEFIAAARMAMLNLDIDPKKTKKELKTELNRLARTHPRTPTRVTGGFIAVVSRASCMRVLSLYQCDFLVIPVHQGRGAQTEEEIHHHDHTHTFNGLPRLVDRGVGHGNEVWEANGNG